MLRMRACVIAALVATSTIAAAQVRGTGPEHGRLTAMAGTWDVVITLWAEPGSRGLTIKGRSTITSLFNGLFIEEKIESAMSGTPFTTLAWTGYNLTTRQYEATRMASTNSALIAETGSYDEKSNEFELKAAFPMAGDTWRQRTIIRRTSADTMTRTSYLSFGKVPEWKGVEVKYTRRPSR